METQVVTAQQGKIPDATDTMTKQVNGGSVTAPRTYGRVRCAIYARYSSDNQRKSSIEDQIRNCREAADRKGWVVLDDFIFSDDEKTGTTLHGRTGFKKVMDLAKTQPKPFEYILVDDTSRFGRNKADAFRNVEILDFHKVHLYFVEDGLDSSESWFEQAFHNNAQRDQQFSKSLSHKVKRGRVGRFIAGYNPGGGCFGYKNVPEEDLTRKGGYGRPAVIGVKQVVDPEQEKIVLRIFQAYASGMSLGNIAAMLNAEGVPTSQGPRSRRVASWSKGAIKTILKNSRYIGDVKWGCTVQVRNPETGKFERRDIPESEWQQQHKPELRIISDELWAKVQQQFKRATRGLGVKRLGGMARTEASRRYLFSGLLKCGWCGANMTVTTTNPPRYGCSSNRNRRTCTNKATIPLALLERDFMASLSQKLQSGDLREELLETLLQNLRNGESKRLSEQNAVDEERGELEETRRTLTTQIQNLVTAVRECGGSRALLADLKEAEAKLDRISERLDSVSRPPTRDITEEQVRAFLNETADSFTDVLLGSPEAVKHELQKRISSIYLTPRVGETGPVYQVSGDVDLFSSPEHVLQSNQVDLIALQYTIRISFDVVPYRNRQKWAA
jgi:site-specific DNA recombinase